ncbi:MAG: hypothetical protein IPK16_31015 [Anaerolineales bacterium]|nr:hypothetical protein [Anaerolineales bacterium]
MAKTLRKLLHDSEVGRCAGGRTRAGPAQGWRHEAWVFVHIEVQSQWDADFPEQTDGAYYPHHQQHTNEPVFSVAVLGDDPQLAT